MELCPECGSETGYSFAGYHVYVVCKTCRWSEPQAVDRDDAAMDALDVPALPETDAEKIERLTSLVERAFRDGIQYASICDVTNVDEAWRTSAARAALEGKDNG